MLGAEDSELAQAVRAFLNKQFDSAALHAFVDSGAHRHSALQSDARDLGLLSLALPERHGGLGLGVTNLVSIYRVLGAFMPPLPAVSMALATDVLTITRSEGWLGEIAAGAAATVLLPSDDAPLQVEQKGNEWEVSGEVALLIDSPGASFFILKGRFPAEAAWFVCPSTLSGVTTTPLPLLDETRSAGRITLQDVRLPANHLIASGAEAQHVDRRLLTHAALAIAADSLGGAAAMLDKTLEYMRTRTQFSRPIGSFQALKHRVANLFVKLATNQALLQESLAATGQQRIDAEDLAALVCAHSVDMYASLAEECLQLHGGIGFTRSHDAHLYLKRSKLNQALLGGPAALRDRAASLSG